MSVRRILATLALTTMFNPLVVTAQVNNVVIDGLFDDWQDENTVFDSDDGVTNLCDNVPGQKDITAAGIASNFDTLQPATIIYLAFLFDEVGVSGANTMDGCWLLDADSTGFVEQALCFTLAGNPATLSDTRYFTCNDTTIDTCAGPTAVTLPASAACAVGTVTGANTINNCHAGEEDRGVECEIALADFPIGVADNTVDLLQACSYPSEQPNSAGSDCVIDAGNPWTINVLTGTTGVTPLPVELQIFSVD